jgi:hypothetical protein
VDNQVHFPLPHGIELIKWPDAKPGLDAVVVGSEAGLHVIYFEPSDEFNADTGKPSRYCLSLRPCCPICPSTCSPTPLPRLNFLSFVPFISLYTSTVNMGFSNMCRVWCVHGTVHTCICQWMCVAGHDHLLSSVPACVPHSTCDACANAGQHAFMSLRLQICLSMCPCNVMATNDSPHYFRTLL